MLTWAGVAVTEMETCSGLGCASAEGSGLGCMEGRTHGPGALRPEAWLHHGLTETEPASPRDGELYRAGTMRYSSSSYWSQGPYLGHANCSISNWWASG